MAPAQKDEESALRWYVCVAFAAGLSVLGATAPASAGGRLAAAGQFTATIDFSTLTLTPVGANCLLEVAGELQFTGTLDGLASASTRALVLAPCEDVAVNPPGTFKDTFRSRLEFAGTVDGTPAIADIAYHGITEVGGNIKALMVLSDGLKGVLKVEAIVAAGGSYEGFVRIE
jgi:hypothetical protein